jgi:hypothetical protein
MTNPFGSKNPVRNESFFDRQWETSRLRDNILKGCSSIITAEPRTGKTSLLYRVQDKSLYERAETHLNFRYLDAQIALGWDISSFWEYAFQEIKEISPALKEAYRSVALNKFNVFDIERILTLLEKSGICLVLLLDEFDNILHQPGLHKAEFYGGLRFLSTNYSSLALIIASRQSLEDLNILTLEFSRTSSPYFNFLEEISLNSFSHDDVNTFLNRPNSYFDTEDLLFLERVSGGHPYFLQTCASYLWDAHEKKIVDSVMRRAQAGEQCFHQTDHILRDTWRTWNPYIQMAFTLAALDAMPPLLPNRQFDIYQLLKDRPSLAPEQRLLKNRGFLRPDSNLEGGFAPHSEIMLWFLAEELTRLLRPENPDLKKWLHDQEWEGLLKHGEKESIQNTLQSLKPIIKDGALSFIKAAAEGLGKGMFG